MFAALLIDPNAVTIESLGSNEPDKVRPCIEAFDKSSAAKQKVDDLQTAMGEEVQIAWYVSEDRCTGLIGRPDLDVAYPLIADTSDGGKVGRFKHAGEGCGEGLLNRVIPDWSFAEACDRHDLCYLFRNNPDDATSVSRRECDALMRREGMQSCSSSPPRGGVVGKGACKATIFGYWLGVRAGGWVTWRRSSQFAD
jgi:hypothetical protein